MRAKAKNETGTPGVDLGSQNFNWSLPLVGLPGRAGLDLNLTLSYNSLVWTKQNNQLQFNADKNYPGPGFRLGLPMLQGSYTRQLDAQTSVLAFMMVTSSGARVEMRRQAATNIYESADNNHVQLSDNGTGGAVVRTTDGTQYQFTRYTLTATNRVEYRCTKITDRNGNFISASYETQYGHITSIVDTLGRQLTFQYDSGNNLWRIKQMWGAVEHIYAQFTYAPQQINTNFTVAKVNNWPANGSNVTVLTQVWVPDGSTYHFSYNTYGQVWKVTHKASNGSEQSYTRLNLPLDQNAGAQGDCPRFSERWDWVLYGVNNASAEVKRTYVKGVTPDGHPYTDEQAPDGAVVREIFYHSGFQEGLTLQTEAYEGSVRKKYTRIEWTQDDPAKTYQINPRIAETNTYDDVGNRRRTTIEYGAYAAWGLPYVVKEYAADGSTLLRHTYTDYNLDNAYTSRRIIGLVHAVHVYDAGNNMLSKVAYAYDWGSEYMADTSATPVQHDGGYGAGFIVGRGNLVSVQRWDVTDPNNGAKVSEQRNGYNKTGSIVFSRDPRGHQTNTGYGDNYHDGVNRNTFAYPTSVSTTDYVDDNPTPVTISSTAQYNFDHGGAVATVDPRGMMSVTTYDSVPRVTRVATRDYIVAPNTDISYTRWVYSADMGSVQQFSLVETGVESHTVAALDGVGRVRATSSPLPGPTAGRYSINHVLYDEMGRVAWRSKPTEGDVSWVPTGDDAVGWGVNGDDYLFDWQGRVKRVTHRADNTTQEITYTGCGCAGGEQVTTKDERGRQRRLTKDVLGRLKKVEEINWSGTVYATTTYTNDALDRVTKITQAGLPDRTFEFDGHGRLWKRTTPEQGLTTYAYHPDDAVQKVTDARDATQTFTYNNRGAVSKVDFGAPQGVAPTPTVQFYYDAAGNRTLMLDGYGSTSYAYDRLSQLTSESRHFNGLTGPNANGGFKLAYEYTESGALKKFTNPWGSVVNYTVDGAGRALSATGAGTMSAATYAQNTVYNAAGAVKSMSYGNARSLSAAYDQRGRLSRWDVPQVAGKSTVMGWQYTYNNFAENTGRVTFADNLYDNTLDRSYDYDSVGRLVAAHSGNESRVHIGLIQPPVTPDGPYAHNYNHDRFGNITQKIGWGGWNASYAAPATYTNNRRDAVTYDAAGNMTNDGSQMTYDAAGKQRSAVLAGSWSVNHYHDGDGLRVKKIENDYTNYYLRSAVFGGQVVAELDPTGQWGRGFVFFGGQQVALQQDGVVYWMHQDPVTKSQRLTNGAGNVTSTIDLDPWGGETNRSHNTWYQRRHYTTYDRDTNARDYAMQRSYHGWFSRFDQADPFDGSYSLSDPQSFNRYAYVQNDPVNFVDPSGLSPQEPQLIGDNSGMPGGVGGFGGFGSNMAGLPGFGTNWGSWGQLGLQQHEIYMAYAQAGFGYGPGPSHVGYAPGHWGPVLASVNVPAEYDTIEAVRGFITRLGSAPWRIFDDGQAHVIMERGAEMGGLGPLDWLIGGSVKGGVAIVGGALISGGLKNVAKVTLTQKGLEHIVYRHWATSGFSNIGRFAQGTSARGLRDMIGTAVANGVSRPNTMGRAGTIFEYNFGRTIGTASSGAATGSLRVVVSPNGNVITAFPIQ